MTQAGDSHIGITSTVPIEVIYAAGLIPVDVNNVFIESAAPLDWVQQAEDAGFPRNCCGWVKGIYTAVRAAGLGRVVAVTQGDCAHTQALMEVLLDDGIETVPFAYPADRDVEAMRRGLDEWAERLGAPADRIAGTKARLDAIRALAHEVDRRTFETDQATGFECHLALVNCSDMVRDPTAYEQHLRAQLAEIEARPPKRGGVRLGLLGVPPIYSGLHALIEESGARVVFSEIPRQFAMPYATDDLAEQYTRYTYPYGALARIEDIRIESEHRRLDGLIHYVQSFCFRQVGDLLLRRHLALPILTLEGDRPGPVDAAARLRIETFIDMLR